MRAEAVGQLTDTYTLRPIATGENADPPVQAAAIERIDDIAALEKIACKIARYVRAASNTCLSTEEHFRREQ